MIIGITGSIGSGKSTVSRAFEKHGFKAIDADIISRKFLEKNTVQYVQLVKYFGIGILDEQGNIDRLKLGDTAFSEKKNYRKLNEIMLPAIINEIKGQIKKIKELNENAVLDAPLLLETRAKEFVDKVVVVKASQPNIFRRNRRFSRDRILNVKKYQMPITEKLKHADYVINNDGNVKSLDSQVMNIIKAVNRHK